MGNLSRKTYGKIIVLSKETGEDTGVFEMEEPSCVIGRQFNCHIRIQVAGVENEHCMISECIDGKVKLEH